VPARLARQGDPWSEMDRAAGSLEPLLALSRRHEAEGLGDAPWPPHFPKQASEPKRVQPSRARGSGRRRPTRPLVTVARASRQDDALAGLERWKARHPGAAARLRPADVLVDSMRGRSSTWTRIRVNLEMVPEDERPAQEPPDPDHDPRG
jgi:bifunctional non-homologous end joining protein LigD